MNFLILLNIWHGFYVVHKFFNQMKQKMARKCYYSTSARMHIVYKYRYTLTNIYKSVCDHYICYSHHHRKIAALWLECGLDDIPFSFSLNKVRDSQHISIYICMYVATFAMHTKPQDEWHSFGVWEHSLWNLWNIHTTRRECIKKHVYVLGVG